MFNRLILKDLEEWAKRSNRKPLILRGARQVGKTSVVEMFSNNFEQFISLNLDNPDELSLFRDDRSFADTLVAIFLYKNLPKSQKSILIFIDEIQQSPRAVNLLRYFYEETPDIFVIAAGSLLETLLDTHISFPVGRVEYLMLHPCSFPEFLIACKEDVSLLILKEKPFPDFAHDKLLKLFRTYTLIGGMPEILSEFSKTNDIVTVSRVFDSLIVSYLDDVEKYARNESMSRVIRYLIRQTYYFASSRITFQGFGNSGYKSREVSEAFDVLQKAMLLHLVYPTMTIRLPTQENIKRSPKLQLNDTGMVNYFAKLQKEIFGSQHIDDAYQGKIAEHIVGQELKALGKSPLDKLLFWTREEKHSQAEIDFIRIFEDLIIPIEVKSGATGRLRSLHQFIEMANHNFAIRVYSGTLKAEKASTLKGKDFYLLSLPFYLVHQIDDYIRIFTNNPESLIR